MAARKRRRKHNQDWDPSLFAMSPERLEEHLKLRTRARRIPDKKKQANKMACRRSASGHWPFMGLWHGVVTHHSFFAGHKWH